MKVSEIMTPEPITIDANTGLQEAMDLMEVQDVRHLPVVRDDWVAGILSDRDLMEATGWPAPHGADEEEGAPEPKVVADVMHQPVSTVSPDDSILTVSSSLILRKIGCLPVVQDGHLVGIVTERDVMKLYGPSWKDSLLSGDVDPFVERHMTPNPLTVERTSTLEAVVEKCALAGIRHLPVVDGETLVGMVSDRDLKKAKGSGLSDETGVDELMTPFTVRVGPRDGLSKAAKIMLESRISALPVLEGDHLVGILTSTDVLHHCIDCLRPRASSS
jgi:CBS domain-containing protein